MRKKFAIGLAAAVIVVYGGCAYLSWHAYGPDKRVLVPLVEPVIKANIALDKALYGDESVFQAREETALGYLKLVDRKPEEAKALLEHAARMRENRFDPDDDERLKAIYHVMSANSALHGDKENVATAERAVTIALENHEPTCEQVPKALQVAVEAHKTVGNAAEAARYQSLLDQWFDLRADLEAYTDAPKAKRKIDVEAETLRDALKLTPVESADKPAAAPPPAVPAKQETTRIPSHTVGVTWAAFEPATRVDLYETMTQRAKQKANDPKIIGLDKALALATLAEIYKGQGRTDPARDTAKSALKLFDAAKYKGKEYVYATITATDEIKPLEALQKLPACNDPLVRARVLEALAKADSENSIEHMEEALRLRRKELGDDNEVVIQTTLNLAEYYDDESTEAMQQRAHTCAERLWAANFRKYGPISAQVLEAQQLCDAGDVSGFYTRTDWQLATLRRLYGKNSAAAAAAAVDEASAISGTDPPQVERKPAPATLGLYLFMLTTFAIFYMTLKTDEAKKGKHEYNKQWKVVCPIVAGFCGILFACNSIIGAPQDAEQWKRAKRKELLAAAIAGFESAHLKTEKLRTAYNQLADIQDQEHDKAAAATREKATKLEVDDK